MGYACRYRHACVHVLILYIYIHTYIYIHVLRYDISSHTYSPSKLVHTQRLMNIYICPHASLACMKVHKAIYKSAGMFTKYTHEGPWLRKIIPPRIERIEHGSAIAQRLHAHKINEEPLRWPACCYYTVLHTRTRIFVTHDLHANVTHWLHIHTCRDLQRIIYTRAMATALALCSSHIYDFHVPKVHMHIRDVRTSAQFDAALSTTRRLPIPATTPPQSILPA